MSAGACIDEAVLLSIRMRQSDAYLIRLIDLLMAEAPARLEDAWAGGRTGDVRRTATAVYTLGCLAGNVGAVTVRALAEEAEASICRGKRGAMLLPGLLYDLEVAWAETRCCLLDARRDMAA